MEIHRNKYHSIFVNSNKLFIVRPRLSVPVYIIPFNNKVEISQVFNSLLKSCVVFKSFMLVSKGSNSLGVYSVSVSDFKNLHTSLIHIKEVGILKSYFANSNVNLIRLTSGLSNMIDWIRK